MYSYLMWTLFSLIEHLRKKRKPSVYEPVTRMCEVHSPNHVRVCMSAGGGGGAEVDYYL